MNIEGSSALVTGGASGLGLATARRLAEAGATVTIVDLPSSQGADVAAGFGGHFAAADVTSVEQVRDAVAQAAASGPLRVVVNCAGIAPPAKVLDRDGNPGSLKDFERIIRINLIGTYNVLSQAAAVMVKTPSGAPPQTPGLLTRAPSGAPPQTPGLLTRAPSGAPPQTAGLLTRAPSGAPPQTPGLLTRAPEGGDRGVIVNTASVAAFDGQIGQPAYSASKGGVHAMTLPVARELARYGIRVCTIAPGIMETPMLKGLPQAAQDSLGEQVPHPSRLGRPEEYAALVLHIVENGYLNGETIRLDGAIRMAPR